jgi:hypothetical protein
MQVPQIRSARAKETIDHAEVLFKIERNMLDEIFQKEPKAARFAAQQIHNASALVPAEVKCYLRTIGL